MWIHDLGRVVNLLQATAKRGVVDWKGRGGEDMVGYRPYFELRRQDAVLTVGRENDFDQCLIDNLGGSVDQLEDIWTVVVVPEQQQAIGQLAQTIFGEL